VKSPLSSWKSLIAEAVLLCAPIVTSPERVIQHRLAVFDQPDVVGRAMLSQTSCDEAGMVHVIFDVQNG
jgi:hypothetical protein